MFWDCCSISAKLSSGSGWISSLSSLVSAMSRARSFSSWVRVSSRAPEWPPSAMARVILAILLLSDWRSLLTILRRSLLLASKVSRFLAVIS